MAKLAERDVKNAEARQFVDRIIARATELGLSVAVAVVDRRGRVSASSRMEGAKVSSLNGATLHARAAVRAAKEGVPSGPKGMWLCDPDSRDEDVVMGAMGIVGASPDYTNVLFLTPLG